MKSGFHVYTLHIHELESAPSTLAVDWPGELAIERHFARFSSVSGIQGVGKASQVRGKSNDRLCSNGRAEVIQVDVPFVGYSGPLASYLTAFKYIRHGRELFQEGYEKYKGRTFKVPSLARWITVISDPILIEEVRKLPYEIVSIEAAFREVGFLS